MSGMDFNRSVELDIFPTPYPPSHDWSIDRTFSSTLYPDVNDSEPFGNETAAAAFSFSVDNMVWSSVELVIAAIGALANGLVIYVIARNAEMRTVPNIYVLNLSVADFLYCGLFVPFLSGYVLNSRGWIFGQAMCVINKAIYAVTVNASILFLTAMSVERFRAVANPLRRGGGRTGTKRTLWTCAGLWVLAAILSLPSTIFARVRVAYKMQHCSIWVPSGSDVTVVFIKSLFMYRFVAWNVVPLCILIPTYVLLYRRIKDGFDITVAVHAHRHRNRNRVTKMVTVIVLFFFVSWIPLHVANIVDHYGTPPYSVPVNVLSFVGMLSSANSAVNPFLYALFGQRFRHHIRRTLCACLGGKAFWEDLSSRLTVIDTDGITAPSVNNKDSVHVYKRGVYLGRFENRQSKNQTALVTLSETNTTSNHRTSQTQVADRNQEVVFVSSV